MANTSHEVIAHIMNALTDYRETATFENFHTDDPQYWTFQLRLGTLLCGFHLARTLSLQEISNRVIYHIAMQQRRAAMYGARKGSPAKTPSQHLKGLSRD
jgi:hypothetical protein